MKTQLRLPMFTFLLTLLCFSFSSVGWGQMFYPLSSGNYSQDFSDISNWTNNYAAGIGSENWRVATSVATSSATNVNVFVTGTSGGVQRGSQTIVFLATGTNAGATDLLMDFSGRIAGNLTFDYEKIANSANATPRTSDLKIQYSIDNGATFTDFTGYSIPRITNNTTPETGAVNINLPSTIDNQNQVVIRFYFWNNGQIGGSGNRPKWSVDNVNITSTPTITTTLIATPTVISDLNYFQSNGPSDSQSFELSGVNLDGEDVDVALPTSSNFEISTNDIDFSNSLNFQDYDGTPTTIYVRLKAGLGNNNYSDDITISGGGADPISVSLSGNVQPQPTLGWQITHTNIPFVIDFDNTAIGANEGQYNGSGFESAPATGRLNSNTFATTGMSDGDTAFGDESIAGDFARGTSTGGVTTGGFYAFEVAPGNHAFGWQATGSDFAPGTITLRMQNQTGFEINTIDVAYLIYEYNDQGRSSSLNFSYSEVFNFYTDVPDLDFISTEAAASSPVWEVHPRNTKITGLAIPAGGFFYFRWTSEDVGGSGSRDELAIDNIRVILNEVSSENYVYEADSWSPEDPNGITNEFDVLVVKDGEATLNQEMGFLDLIVAPGAKLKVEKSIQVNGNIIANGELIFVSNATTTGQLDAFDGIIAGEVEVQRYIPARRAFRFLSSAVTTTGNINSNWQEGAVNATDNPNPGFGTHITGSTTGANGFDATPSGNFSLFTLNNAGQAWEPVTNTDVNTINAGTAYRLFVRGDRSIDVTDNNATPTNTTLRTTGSLHTGSLTASDLSNVENEFNFFGNPYPAAVDMNDVIAASTNINPNVYYIWDPTLGTRGAYVTIDLPAGTNASSSAGNRYLQPGQAAFVTTLANGAASLQFEETHKNVAAPLTTVFDISSQLDLRLYRADAFAAGEKPSDGLRFKFGEENTNDMNPQDAPKFFNQDENLASSNDNRLWSIESRALPLAGESIPLFTNQYRTTDYIFEADLTEINDITALLVDNFTGTTTQLENNENTLYAFTINPDNPESIATDRFEIVFEELLSVNDESFGAGFVLFPNPAKEYFTIATRGISGEEVTLSITNVLGQTVVTQNHTVNANGQLTINTNALTQGVYIVKLTHTNGGQFTTKMIKN